MANEWNKAGAHGVGTGMRGKINRSNKTPLYHQLVEFLQAEIRRGKLKPGDRIASERELCEMHAVSRITVVKALSILAREGWLTKEIGRGTFVAPRRNTALNDDRQKAVGLIIPGFLGDSFYCAIVHGVEDALYQADVPMLLHLSGKSPEKEWQGMERFSERQVSGVILFMGDSADNWENIRRFKDRGIPLVLIDRRIPMLDDDIDTVASDNIKGAFEAVRHLVERGHRRIGMISVPERLSTVIDREHGYRLGLEACGINPVPEWLRIVKESDRVRLGEEGMRQLLMLGERPTAILAISDSAAIGAVRVVKARGLRIPEDIAVVGFDDVKEAALTEPALTTVRQLEDKIGATAVQLILDRIHGLAAPARHVVVGVELVVRKSS